MGVRYDTLVRLQVYDRLYDWIQKINTGSFGFLQKKWRGLLGEASKEDELKQSSQFQDEDHAEVIDSS